MLQQHLQNTTGKCVILKDISNLKYDIKKQNGYNMNDLQALVNKLQRKEGTYVYNESRMHVCTYSMFRFLS